MMNCYTTEREREINCFRKKQGLVKQNTETMNLSK